MTFKAPVGWTRTDPRPWTKTRAQWAHATGWRAEHCGHPTALYPWALYAPDGALTLTGAKFSEDHDPTKGRAWPDLAALFAFVDERLAELAPGMEAMCFVHEGKGRSGASRLVDAARTVIEKVDGETYHVRVVASGRVLVGERLTFTRAELYSPWNRAERARFRERVDLYWGNGSRPGDVVDDATRLARESAFRREQDEARKAARPMSARVAPALSSGAQGATRARPDAPARLDEIASSRKVAVGLVACGKEKAAAAAPARELYTGSLFRAALADAIATNDVVFVVSAKHGLVELDRVIEPYDDKLTRGRAYAWAEDVVRELDKRIPWRRQVTIHAGDVYASALAARLRKDAVDPFEGKTLGARLAAYKARRTMRERVAAFEAAGGRGLTDSQRERVAAPLSSTEEEIDPMSRIGTKFHCGAGACTARRGQIGVRCACTCPGCARCSKRASSPPPATSSTRSGRACGCTCAAAPPCARARDRKLPESACTCGPCDVHASSSTIDKTSSEHCERGKCKPGRLLGGSSWRRGPRACGCTCAGCTAARARRSGGGVVITRRAITAKERTRRAAAVAKPARPAARTKRPPQKYSSEELAEHYKRAIARRGVTIQSKSIRCSAGGCGGCPHGAYYYGYFRTPDGKLHAKYLGKEMTSEIRAVRIATLARREHPWSYPKLTAEEVLELRDLRAEEKQGAKKKPARRSRAA